MKTVDKTSSWKTRVLKKLMPTLFWENKGYFLVVTAMSLIHVVLAVATMSSEADHHSTLYALVNGHMWIYIMMHWLILLLTLIGLYVPRLFNLTRLGGVMSACLYNAYAASAAVTAFQNRHHVPLRLSLFGPLALMALSLNSIYIAREPRLPMDLIYKLADVLREIEEAEQAKKQKQSG